MIYSIIELSCIALPLVLGAYLTISLLKLPDFSIESAYLFGAVGAVMSEGLPLPLIIMSSVVGGMLVGAVVSILNQLFNIPFLLAAIVTNGLFHGLTQYFLGTSVKSFHLQLNEFYFLIICSLILIGIMYYLLHTQLGYSLAIFGNNPHFFQHHKVSGRYVVFFGVMAGHGLAGLGGFLFAQSNGFVDLSMNFGIILLCITSLMVGKMMIRKSNVFVPVAGIIAYFIIQQGLLNMGLNLKYFNAFQAFFILGVLLVGKKKESLTFDHLGV